MNAPAKKHLINLANQSNSTIATALMKDFLSRSDENKKTRRIGHILASVKLLTAYLSTCTWKLMLYWIPTHLSATISAPARPRHFYSRKPSRLLNWTPRLHEMI